MPEGDFIASQVATVPRSERRRWRDLTITSATMTALFLVLLGCLLVQKLPAFIAYMAAVAAITYVLTRSRWTMVRTEIRTALQGERRLAAALLVVFLAAFPILLRSDPYLIQIGALTGIYLIMALGLNVTLGYAGLLDIGFAVYFGAGAYTSAQLAVNFGLSFWFGLPLAGTCAAFFGFVVAWPALRVQDHYLGLVTLGYGLMMTLLARNLSFLTNGTDGVINIPPPALGTHSFTDPIVVGGLSLPFQANFYYLAVGGALVAVVVALRLRDSAFGRELDAIREDEIAARCSGVDVRRMKILAFSTGAFFGGIGGAIYAPMIGFIGPDSFTFLESITILVMVVLGGAGSIMGVAAGTVVLVILPERFREFENLRLFFFGIALVLLMIKRPQGLFPRVRSRRLLDLRQIGLHAALDTPGHHQSSVQPADG